MFAGFTLPSLQPQSRWVSSTFCPSFYLHYIVDNIAPPVASCLGDLLTLTLLALSSTVLLHLPSPSPFLLLIFLFVLAVLAFRSTLKNTHVRDLLWNGWTPLLVAMLISSGTGLVLEKFVKKYEGFAMMAVVISGACFAYPINPKLIPSRRLARFCRFCFYISPLDCTSRNAST